MWAACSYLLPNIFQHDMLGDDKAAATNRHDRAMQAGMQHPRLASAYRHAWRLVFEDIMCKQCGGFARLERARLRRRVGADDR